MRKTAVVYSTAGAYSSMPHLYIHQPTPIIIKRPDNVTWHRPNSRLRHTIIAASSALLQAIHTFVPDSNSNARYSHPAAANRALGFSASKELFHTEGTAWMHASAVYGTRPCGWAAVPESELNFAATSAESVHGAWGFERSETRSMSDCHCWSRVA